MAFQPMALATSGGIASSAEYNKVVGNVVYHEDIIGQGVFTDVDTISAWSSDAAVQLTDLDSRVDALEAVPPGAALMMAHSMDLNSSGGLDPFSPSPANSYQFWSAGLGSYIEFPNPGQNVTAYGIVTAHFNGPALVRAGAQVRISMDGGTEYQAPIASPLTTIEGGATAVVVGQFAFTGTPTGTVRVRAYGLRETLNGSFYRGVLYAQLLGTSGTPITG